MQNMRDFILVQKCIPWRVKNKFIRWREAWLKNYNLSLYKLLKYGCLDLNTRSYWNCAWGTENSKEMREYEELFNNIADLVPHNARVLDIGCGVGLLLKRLKEQKNCDCVGVDISDVAINALRQHGIPGQVSKLPRVPFPDETFDVVVGTEVLEHLKNPAATVRQMARVAKKGGLLVVSVPNNMLGSQEELEHLHCFTEEDMISMLSQYAEVVHTNTGKYMNKLRAEYLIVCGVKK